MGRPPLRFATQVYSESKEEAIQQYHRKNWPTMQQNQQTFRFLPQNAKKAAGGIEKSTLPAANKCVLWVYRGGRRVQVCYDSQNSEKYLFVRDKL
jgi:hypothetical protein